MARGRRHVPPGTEIGIWFQHRGAQSANPLQRQQATSTGAMLADPFRSTSEPPPEKFGKKSERNYRTTNRFSEHDNRNAFQDHGVYFGDGQTTRQLGRNLVDPHERLHHTERDYLKHHGRQVTDFEYHTNYQVSYKGKETEAPPTRRRFAKSLPPAEPGRVALTTTTTDWLPSESQKYKTHTQVLAVSQEPFLKHNPWQYSYNSKRNVYPQYNRKNDSINDNMLNRYGAAFNTSSNFNSTGFSGFTSMETTGCS